MTTGTLSLAIELHGGDALSLVREEIHELVDVHVEVAEVSPTLSPRVEEDELVLVGVVADEEGRVTARDVASRANESVGVWLEHVVRPVRTDHHRALLAEPRDHLALAAREGVDPDALLVDEHLGDGSHLRPVLGSWLAPRH